MDCPKFIVSNQKEESISTQRVKCTNEKLLRFESLFRKTDYCGSVVECLSLRPRGCGFELHQSLGLARLIEISVNRSIYKRKTIIDMKIQKSVTFNGCSVYLFN